MNLISATIVAISSMTPSGFSPQQSQADKWLVIEFPDGVLGGKGDIQGQGNQDESTSNIWNLTSTARKCGARYPMLSDNLSHSVHMVSLSTEQDRQVVVCLQNRLSTHFNAGIADAPYSLALVKMDREPFREFWRSSSQSHNKAD